MKQIRLTSFLILCIIGTLSTPASTFSQSENDLTDHTPTKEELLRLLNQPRPRAWGKTCTFHKSRAWRPSPADKSVSLEVHFAPNDTNPLTDSRETLQVLGEVISTVKHACFEIVGHTDNRGSASANLRLSQRRANRIVEYLAEEFNIPRDQMQARGAGETKPMWPNHTADGRRKNRRVEAISTLSPWSDSK